MTGNCVPLPDEDLGIDAVDPVDPDCMCGDRGSDIRNIILPCQPDASFNNGTYTEYAGGWDVVQRLGAYRREQLFSSGFRDPRIYMLQVSGSFVLGPGINIPAAAVLNEGAGILRLPYFGRRRPVSQCIMIFSSVHITDPMIMGGLPRT